MDKKTSLILIITACLSFFLGQTISTKAEGRGFAGVIPFNTPTGMLGFFDQNNGKIYVYDSNFKLCTFVGQVNSLGSSIQTGNNIRAEQPDKTHTIEIVKPTEEPKTIITPKRQNTK